jgi:hypothetical protein
MKREEKLALLKGIQDGVLTKEHLEPPQIYIFLGNVLRGDELEGSSTTFTMRGNVYTDEERLDFISKIDVKNEALVKLGVFKNAIEFKDTHITISFK